MKERNLGQAIIGLTRYCKREKKKIFTASVMVKDSFGYLYRGFKINVAVFLCSYNFISIMIND